MDRMRRQRGYTRLPKLILLLVVVAAGYLGVTFWPAARSHYRIKNDAKRLANQMMQANADKDRLVNDLIGVMYDRDGLVVTRGEVLVDDSVEDLVRVSIRVELPYEYPLVHKEGLWKTTIEVHAERARGF